jgi:DNA polymerase V
MSERVMGILQAHCADMEVYSIDEAFLRFGALRESEEALLAKQAALRETILRSTGIPVSIGLAPTKTLAKLANRLAKSQSERGVYALSPGAAELSDIPVEKVWGVAEGYKKRLAKIGVETVSQLAQAPQEWIQREFGVVGVRILKELQGFPALDLEPPVAARQNVMVSRSFSKDVYAVSEIVEAVSVYASRVGEKLRRYGQVAGQLTVFLMANPFRNLRPDGRGYFTRTIELPLATSNANELAAWANRVARHLFEPGTNYKKAGVLAGRLRPGDAIQGNLFAPAPNRKKQDWSRREQWSSPRYTTRWEEILRVKI